VGYGLAQGLFHTIQFEFEGYKALVQGHPSVQFLKGAVFTHLYELAGNELFYFGAHLGGRQEVLILMGQFFKGCRLTFFSIGNSVKDF